MADNIKKLPTVRISYDELYAFMMVPILQVNEHYTLEELTEVLKARGIRFGIKQDVLEAIIEGGEYGHEVLVAEGTPKADGADGFFQFNFNVDFNNKPIKNGFVVSNFYIF